jgi:hypothetical protein
VSDLFEASIAAAGRELVRAITQDGSRGVGIARGATIGSTELVTVVGPGVDDALLVEHAGWDLELAEARSIDTTSGPRTFVAERLGANATPAHTVGATAAPAFQRVASELVRRVAAAHARDELVGALHPALLFVGEDAGTLIGVAQRPLRLASTHAVEGDRPLFGYGHLSPGDLAGTGGSRADDIFRVGVTLWRLRHGTHPFGNLADTSLAAMIAEIGLGTAARVEPSGDPIDEVLARCFDPDPDARPAADQLLEALGRPGSE